LGIEPYTIIEANGIQVGIIGLTTTRTPRTTNPVNVAEFEFIEYETALRQIVPEAKAQGA
jgi:2',3'-cyclic-nucleotide 2'-phosphodiesterase (5'-nucleotidase family)